MTHHKSLTLVLGVLVALYAIGSIFTDHRRPMAVKSPSAASVPHTVHGKIVHAEVADGRLVLLVQENNGDVLALRTTKQASIVSWFPRVEHTPESGAAYAASPGVLVMLGVTEDEATDVIMMVEE